MKTPGALHPEWRSAAHAPAAPRTHCFISLQDETGIANPFVNVKIFPAYRLVVVESFVW
jgi:hypothetical protein